MCGPWEYGSMGAWELDTSCGHSHLIDALLKICKGAALRLEGLPEIELR